MLAKVLEQLLNQTDLRISRIATTFSSMSRPKIRVNDSRWAAIFL
jgi:hypothetical protein